MYSAFDSAYDEAIEKSRMRVSKENGSSGYSSDADTSDENISACGSDQSITSSSPSSTAESSGDSSEIESSDIESEISFLQKKQTLMKRAISAMKREEEYDASQAREIIQLSKSDCSPLWQEAKEVLEVLNRRGDKESAPKTKKRPPQVKSHVKIQAPKRSRIDLSSVVCLSAHDFEEKFALNVSPNALPAMTSMPLECSTGSWVGFALACCLSNAPAQSTTSFPDRHWGIFIDPNKGQVIFPPGKQVLQNTIRLKDALDFTSAAQLIALPSPPFSIVHANKAFSILSGLPNHEVIGKPLELILQVKQETTGAPRESNAMTQDSSLQSELFSSKKRCSLDVIPVNENNSESTRSGMTHLLVKVVPAGHHPCTDNGMNERGEASPMHSKSDPRHILGTVG